MGGISCLRKKPYRSDIPLAKRPVFTAPFGQPRDTNCVQFVGSLLILNAVNDLASERGVF